MSQQEEFAGRVGVPEEATGIAHHRFFTLALDEAIADLARRKGPGNYEVELRFEARVDVRNPGSVGDYRIVLKPIGG